MAQVSNYDSAGRPSRDALANDMATLGSSLQTIHRAAVAVGPDPGVPETLIHYVENGRNPDIYTREFVELVRRLNQLMRGKMHAFTSFRDVLAREMDGALPELRDDVRRVVEATGGIKQEGGGGETRGAGGAGAGAA